MNKDQQIVYDSIKIAHSQLEQAFSLFDEITDVAAIDYASYNLLAARARYSYLIKVAKKMGITL